MSPGPSTSRQPAPVTFADLPNDCIIDILSFAGAPSSSTSLASCSSSTSGDFRDLGRALCAAPWLRELGEHAWAATVRRRWPRWAAIADAAREKRAIAVEPPRCSKAEEIAWRRQAELFELREREELAIAPLAGGAIAKKQTVVQPRHRAVLAEWLAEVRAISLFGADAQQTNSSVRNLRGGREKPPRLAPCPRLLLPLSQSQSVATERENPRGAESREMTAAKLVLFDLECERAVCFFSRSVRIKKLEIDRSPPPLSPELSLVVDIYLLKKKSTCRSPGTGCASPRSSTAPCPTWTRTWRASGWLSSGSIR